MEPSQDCLLRRPRLAGALVVCCLLLIAGGSLLAACSLPPVLPEPTATSLDADDLPVPTVAISPTATITPGVTVIVFWEPYMLERPEGALLVELVREFEAQTSDIRVEVIPKSGALAVHDALLAQLEAGETLPDLAVAFPSSIATLAMQGSVVPLDAYANDPDVGLSAADVADLTPGYLDAGRLPGLGGQLLALPFVQNAVGMWVNDSLLAQAGWQNPPATWIEFEQACLDVQVQAGARCLPFVESVSVLYAWLYSRGGQPLADGGQQAAFNSPAAVESLALLRRLIDAGLAWRPAEEYGDYVAFARGEAAFAFSSTGNNRLYRQAYDQAVQGGVPAFEWRQVMIPQTDPAQPATLAYGTSLFILRTEPARQQAAWRLLRWLIAPEQTARWAEGLQGLPVRASALAVMTDTLSTYPFLEAQVTGILPYAQPEPAIPAELEVREILYTAILSVTEGYAEPQAALDWAAGEANAVLGRQP